MEKKDGIKAPAKDALREGNANGQDKDQEDEKFVVDSDSDKTKMEKLREFFEDTLSVFNSFDDGEEVLTEATLDGVVDYIKKNNVTKIITMAGAGISTSAGIPDFRSPKSGLYDNLQKYKLPHPQAIFCIDFFKENPEPFFILAKELLPEGFFPTPCHYFIKLLNDKGLLVRHYTQNIDTLERVAGLPPEKIVEAHGTFHTGRCLKCRAPYDLPWMKEKIMESNVPICEECNEGVVKPDIIFFGEELPDRFHRLSRKDFDDAELLIIMGSSLVVQPFASLIDKVSSKCPRLLINREKVGGQDRLSRFFGGKSGLRFESATKRDVAWLGDCDDGVKLFAEKLGWGEEFESLMSEEVTRLKNEQKKI